MRRLPVYLLIDTSGSMRGESIHSVNVGVQAMLSALRQERGICLRHRGTGAARPRVASPPGETGAAVQGVNRVSRPPS